jgi:hypothetical protein
MPNYAVHDGQTVVNVIIADSAEIAEELTGLTVVETQGEPWIGWTMENEGWQPPAPFPSWVWNGDEWEAPVQRPDGDYTWDETTVAWVPLPQPFPSWAWIDNTWQPPIPYPSDGAPYYWDEQQGDWIEYVAPEPVTE